MTQKIIAAALILGTAGLWASTAVKVEPQAAAIPDRPAEPNDRILTPGIDYPFPPAVTPPPAPPRMGSLTSTGGVYTQPAQQPQQYAYARRARYGRFGRFLGYETVLVNQQGAVCGPGGCGSSAGSGRQFRPLQRIFGGRR